MSRKLLLIPVVFISVTITVMGFLSANNAHACLPCYCVEFQTLNCYGEYGANTVSVDGECSIEVRNAPKDGTFTLAVQIDAEELDELPQFPDRNILIAARNSVYVYKLRSGEYQINVGPNDEGKVFVLRFYGCPAANIVEEVFYPGVNRTEEVRREPITVRIPERPADDDPESTAEPESEGTEEPTPATTAVATATEEVTPDAESTDEPAPSPTATTTQTAPGVETTTEPAPVQPQPDVTPTLTPTASTL